MNIFCFQAEYSGCSFKPEFSFLQEIKVGVSGCSFVNMVNIKENKKPTLSQRVVKSKTKMTGLANPLIIWPRLKLLPYSYSINYIVSVV